MASHRDPLRDYQVFADGLRDQNRVERQRGNQKDINESLSRLLEQSEAIAVGSLTRSRHFNSSASLMSLFPSNPERFPTSRTMKLGLRDHELISAIRKQKTTRPRPKLIEYSSMKGFENDRFQADLGILHISSMTLMIFVNTGTSYSSM